MLESTLSLFSLWTSMNSWLTPAVLFLLLNLMIGTIAVTSAFSSSPKPHHHINHHVNHHVQPPPQIQTQLSRSPSVLQRLKSLSFYPSYFNSTHHPHHQQQHHQQQQSPAFSEPESEPHHEEVHEAARAAVEEEVVVGEVHDEDEGPTLEEVFSKIVKKGNYGRQNSDMKPTGGELPVPLPRKIIQKSATDDSAFAHSQTTTTTTDDNADVAVASLPPLPPPPATAVDEMADDFINRFRQNLRLQRLESLYGSDNNNK